MGKPSWGLGTRRSDRRVGPPAGQRRAPRLWHARPDIRWWRCSAASDPELMSHFRIYGSALSHLCDVG